MSNPYATIEALFEAQGMCGVPPGCSNWVSSKFCTSSNHSHRCVQQRTERSSAFLGLYAKGAITKEVLEREGIEVPA